MNQLHLKNLEKNSIITEGTFMLHERMKRVIRLIYETNALHCWAYDPGDDDFSIGGMLGEVYRQISPDRKGENI